ncbi:hypothetical protein AKJ57_02025 [candidate division MSBL1 archaeon SCGC-AAA259A05]|uniref:HIT domain-containing protein n=1 Tax=candidate division MSBL1 archaeon SCGC-AAA259A05 TaxID=1698259 RepID=A0A133UAK9_9EURY|nr:hypothetical protein AKJ57_02025 [candidate division MSBL1 archaeon SCGC-AAA259A05]
MENCIFCKIVDGKIESEKIYETASIISFLDINPKAPGHSLVIPKEHVEILTELEDELACEIFKVTKRVEEMLKESLDADAFTIGINDGKAAGQEIPHLHINVLPRFMGNGGKPIHSVVKNPPKEEVPKIAEKIRKTSISP